MNPFIKKLFLKWSMALVQKKKKQSGSHLIFLTLLYTFLELFIVACLGVVSHFRFRRLLANARDSVNGRAITQKIRYFQEINVILSTVLFGHGTLLTILSCDGLTRLKALNVHKFTADFFICNSKVSLLLFTPKKKNTHTF
jgi:hypothetical protein